MPDIDPLASFFPLEIPPRRTTLKRPQNTLTLSEAARRVTAEALDQRHRCCESKDARLNVLKFNLGDDKSFALINVHRIDFAIGSGVFSRVEVQGFVGFRLKPCNFGSGHEAPPTPRATRRSAASAPNGYDRSAA